MAYLAGNQPSKENIDTGITPYHAKYFAHELTKRCPSDDLEKIAASLIDAQVDLNPHQVEAALFAFRSPLSKGALLADEVGLGKTIEAGILLSQKWAERKRKLLVIVPSNLRKQWNQELADKFFLSSVLLETKSFNEQIKQKNLNPFDRSEIVICSFQFARSKDSYVSQINWDLVIIDEAHRLRNVYKPTNKIGNALKAAVAHCPKVLLTATPLQNSLLELYGLVSIIDEHIFGDLKSFKSQFSRLTTEEDFQALKERIKPLCQRTLRRQVLEYVSYTNRIALVEEFVPSDLEQKLYNLVSDYLQRPNLYALPKSQRQLMTLILRRLLASSTFAIAGTLDGLANKLKDAAAQQAEVTEVPADLAENLEAFDELADDWEEETADDGDSDDEDGKQTFTPEQLRELEQEMQSLRMFADIAKSILKNSKGERLLTALKRGFAEAKAKGGSEKAIIFTESTRTQEYLRSILEETAYKGKIVLFNGSNNDSKSKEIYKNWVEKHKDTDKITGSKTADMRAALVDYFRDEAFIMIATEAAAEGINLQFCSLVINYDLPWNPQRIEQRIGRCHRYGQKHDVVVVNFLNKKNAADQRVYQLLAEKFQLFNGVFGASDEVLGSIGSGLDFEKRIVDIYQKCRTEEQIEFSFNHLQQEMESQIDERMQITRQKLLENFDEEVHEKLRTNIRQSREAVSRYDAWLWQITRFYLAPYAQFEDGQDTFTLIRNPFLGEPIHPGPYRSGKDIWNAPEVRKLRDQWETEIDRIAKKHPSWTRRQCNDLATSQGQGINVVRDPQREDLYRQLQGAGAFLADADGDKMNLYRLGHPLAQRVVEECKRLPLADSELVFRYSGSGKKISVLESLVGKSGWLRVNSFSVAALEAEDHLLLAGLCDDGTPVDCEQCRRFFSLFADGTTSDFRPNDKAFGTLKESIAIQQSSLLQDLGTRNVAFFDAELDKLDRWGEDKRNSLKVSLKELDEQIKAAKKEARLAPNLPEKLKLERERRLLETKRDEAWKAYEEAAKDIEVRKDGLIDEIENRMKQLTAEEILFTIRWRLV
jgi:superfamily II DNA or RNA helicase